MSAPYYRDYLQLPRLLSSQRPLSSCHDEFLFISVHQVFELWFRQILWELESVTKAFSGPHIEEKVLAQMVARLERIKNIVRLFPAQIDILETMSPMDFLEFRDLLGSASGFQSLQFRQVEYLLGVNKSAPGGVAMSGGPDERDRLEMEKFSRRSNLLGLVEKWLERMPFARGKDFDFWREYAVVAKKLESVEGETFESLLDSKKHEELVAKGKRRLSREASFNALFILCFRDEPVLRVPFQLISTLMDIDEHFTSWRYRHSLLAHRMLGTKMGTGGSSGHQYLKGTAEKDRAFRDLFELSGFLVSREKFPPIPESLKRSLDFVFSPV